LPFAGQARSLCAAFSENKMGRTAYIPHVNQGVDVHQNKSRRV
jgi:hypothetical protein